MRPRSLYLDDDGPIVRVRLMPDDPEGLTAPRPRGSRRPHTDGKVARVRRLVEETTLTYGEIAAKTGVARATICRWTQDFGWQRHGWAPCATDRMPSARASARLKSRTLFRRLQALAERHIRELEASACVDPDKLADALELMKMAKVAARPKRRKPKAEAESGNASQPFASARGTPPRERGGDLVAGAQRPHPPAPDESPTRAAMRELRAAGVNTWLVPDEMLEDFIASRSPPPEKPRGRFGRRSSRLSSAEHHAWLLRPVRPRS